MKNELMQEISELKAKIKLLNDPAVKKLADLHPDATWTASAYSNAVRGQIHVWADDYDISSLEGVWTDSTSYNFAQSLVDKTYRRDGKELRVRLSIRAEQRFTDEEKEILRSIGKLQKQTSEYETLVCGV